MYVRISILNFRTSNRKLRIEINPKQINIHFTGNKPIDTLLDSPITYPQSNQFLQQHKKKATGNQQQVHHL